MISNKVFLCISSLLIILTSTAFSQQEMFDDFNYESSSDPELYEINKWIVIDGESGPPAGGIYSSGNITFYGDPKTTSNRLMGIATTATNVSSETRHARIETNEMPYLYGTYAALVYFDDTPSLYGDGNVETFYTINNYSTCTQADLYSEIDFEYLPYDLWGNLDKTMYLTTWETCELNNRAYTSVNESFAGWHLLIYTCLEGEAVKYYVDGELVGILDDFLPDSYQNISFANWIINNDVGTSSTKRNTTMQVDWVYYAKDVVMDQEGVLEKISALREEGIVRKNLSGDQVISDLCAPSSLIGYISTNGGGLQQSVNINISEGEEFSISPQPDEGSWYWTGPNNFSSEQREITIQDAISSNAGTYIGTYTNTCGTQSTISFYVTIEQDNDGITGLSGTYILENKKSGLVMGIASDDTDENPNVLQLENTNSENQQFTLSEISSGIYSLKNVQTGKSLTIANSSTDDFANVLLSDYKETTNQLFSIEIVINETYYKLVAVHSNKIVEVGWGSTDINANIDQYTDNGQTCGQWELLPVENTDWSIKIEAEDLSNSYGIQLEDCSEGGQNVAYIDQTDWMLYSGVEIPYSGTYTFQYRVASESTGGQLSLDYESGAVVVDYVDIPATGAWQTWTTVSSIATLDAGTYNFGIYAQSGGWNLNWFSISYSGVKSPEGGSALTDVQKNINIYPNPVTDKIYISGSDNKALLEIYTITGTKIQTGHGTSVDVSSMKKGTYILVIKNGDSIECKKFIKM